MHERKNFIVRREHFTCDHCGTQNTAEKGLCRNHCKKCLWSKHVDLAVPGDRASTCRGLMKPEKVEGGTNRKGYTIIHRCENCGKEMRNKVAPDDMMDTLIAIARGCGST